MKGVYLKSLVFVALVVSSVQLRSSSPFRILVVQRETVPDFSAYISEILQAEGLADHERRRLAELSRSELAGYRLVLLPSGPWRQQERERLASYVKAGGNLIAFLPEEALSLSLGLRKEKPVTEHEYIHFVADADEAAGLTTETLQIQGPSGHYIGADADVDPLAWFGQDKQEREVPAVSLINRGKGKFVSYGYDLPWSIALSRQGNPDWANQENDAVEGLRPNDMFLFGNERWVDLEKVLIPQADEQMHFLAGIVNSLLLPEPLPRVWHFPDAARAALILTADHEFGTSGEVEAVRADMLSLEVPLTMYLTRPFGEGGAPSREEFRQSWLPHGLSVGAHFAGTSDVMFPTEQQIRAVLGRDAQEFRAVYGMPVRTTRMHNLRWIGWVKQARLLGEVGVGMDLSYVNFIPVYDGYMTGSGLPMRFVDRMGRTVNVFQQLTQYEDDVIISQMNYAAAWSLEEALSNFANLLRESIQRYHTAITINFHPPFYLADLPDSHNSSQEWAQGCITIAKEMGVPVLSADQWHGFVRGRDGVRIKEFSEDSGAYEFLLHAPQRVEGLALMIPRTQREAIVEIDGREVKVSAKEFRQRDYLVYIGDFEGTYRVRVRAQ